MSAGDLTRWNRAGRRHIDYVDGNAASLLERLRVTLANRYTTASGQQPWTALHEQAVDVESDDPLERAHQLSEQLDRIRARYEAEPGDIGWELARTFARACHVLAGHIDAYANEHYLETATQWESLRMLVAMLDYSPTPPASASVPIIVQSKAAGRIEAGALQVSHSPPTGEPVVFESLEALELVPELDGMRLAGWNRSPELALVRAMVWEPSDELEATVGDVVLVTHASAGLGFASTIAWIEPGRLSVAGEPREPWPVAQTQLLLGSKGSRVPNLQGPRLVHVERGHGIDAGNVIGWQHERVWQLALVEAADAVSLRLAPLDSRGLHVELHANDRLEFTRYGRDLVLPRRGDPLFRARAIPDGEVTPLPLNIAALAWRDDEQMIVLDDPALATSPIKGEPAMLRRLRPGIHTGTLYLIGVHEPSKVRVTAAPPRGWLGFEGGAPGWTTGTWFVGESEAGELEALRLLELTSSDRGSQARFERAGTRALVRVHGPFKHCLRPRGWSRNLQPIAGTQLTLERIPNPALLGRRVLVRGGAGAIHVARVVRRTGPVIELAPAIDVRAGFRLGELEVHGNVVLFGHGERRPAQILGSGNATQSNQRFVLGVRGVSFVADPSRTTGVRADVELLVAGRRWQQVDSLRDSGPADEHYVVHMTDRGELVFEFGDGSTGRRLPSGTNNLRVEPRVGTGLAGNLPAGCLERLSKPHRLVAALSQPLPARGGNDMAGVEQLREHAPATVLVLGRAVSLEDFAALACTHASVWQARARQLPSIGARERVEVIVVPAGGGELGSLADALGRFLLARSYPDIDVVIRAYVERHFALTVWIESDLQRYEARDVEDRVRAVLTQKFSLARRRLGQALEPAQVIAAVESVPGVLQSKLFIDGQLAGGGGLTSYTAAIDEVFVLGTIEILPYTQRESGKAVELVRAIARCSVCYIQGVGKLLPASRTIGALAASDPLAVFDPSKQQGRRPTDAQLRNFVIKARLLVDLRVPEALIVRLATRSLAELLEFDAKLLAAHHEVELASILELREQLRPIQLCLHVPALEQIRLAAFSLEPTLEQLLIVPEPKLRAAARLPATIIDGVGRPSAELLAAAPFNIHSVLDVANMHPVWVAQSSSVLHPNNMWEIKTKARMLLELQLPAGLSSDARSLNVAGLLALDKSRLRKLSGLPDAELSGLQRVLLLLELVLDKPALESLTLADLFD